MRSLTLVLADQLFENHPALGLNTDFILAENKDLCNRFNYHKYKLTYILSCLREYKSHLQTKLQQKAKQKGQEKAKIHYYKLEQGYNFTTAITQLVTKHGYTKLYVAEVADKPARLAIQKLAASLNLKLEILPSPAFLTTVNSFREYLNGNKNKNPYIMNSFYIWQRKRLNIFTDGKNKPLFGRWSFDSQNRKKLPKTVQLPESLWEYTTNNYTDVANTVEQNFNNNPGHLNTKYSWLPLNHKQAKQKLTEFIETKLNLFGDYEDALTKRDDFVFHSVLSPMLNNGLLTPQQVLDEVLKYSYNFKQDELESFYNSVEGFIRQVIGWREWMKLLYEFKYDSNFKELNFFESKTALPDYFYNPQLASPKELENEPLMLAIQKTQKLGWSHHIERLMILANWMTLNGYNPLDCYMWFMSMFVDAYEWVMVANVYGMGMFADGGMFATKPYIAGGNYIKKMSDYEDTGWGHVWTDKYWEFLRKNKPKLKSNPRMSLILSKHDLRKTSP